MKRVLFASLAVVAIAASDQASAEFPDRPITLIVPYSAGGPADTIARPLAQHMGDTLGQQIIIENVTGAGGTIGAQRAARAVPDGYTILLHNLGLPAAPRFFRNPGYDTETSLAPIGLVNNGPMVLVARKSFEANDAQQLWLTLKKEGDKISMAHAGLGANSHLCGILLNRALGINVTFVPYKGTGPAMNDILGGQVDLVCDQSTTAIPQIINGNDQIGTILITHLHGDHFGGLVFLLREATLYKRRTNPLTVAGPPGLAERLREAIEVFFPGGAALPTTFQLNIRELPPNVETSVNMVLVTAFPIQHPCGAVPYAYRIKVDGKVIAYTADTTWLESLIDLGRSADLFLCEAYTYREPMGSHLDYLTVCERLPEIQPKRTLITHLGPEMIDRLTDLDLEAASDGMLLTF
jgi:ribonuclease BN (tRNA processing enzyme)